VSLVFMFLLSFCSVHLFDLHVSHAVRFAAHQVCAPPADD